MDHILYHKSALATYRHKQTERAKLKVESRKRFNTAGRKRDKEIEGITPKSDLGVLK